MNTNGKTLADLDHVRGRIDPQWGRYLSIGEGWAQLVYDLDAELAKIDPDYKIAQVKEKFGGLRYYLDSPETEAMRELIRQADTKSFETCENDGEPGESWQFGYWTTTVCPDCAAELKEKKKNRGVQKPVNMLE